MKILFLSITSAVSATGSAQIHRLRKLEAGLGALGIQADRMALRDMPVARPTLVTPLNLPFALGQIKHFDFIHAISDAAYAAALWKPLHRAPVVYDVDADGLAEAKMYWEARKSPRTAFWVFQSAVMSWIACHASDHFITVSSPLLERLVNRKGVPREKVNLVRNGVDTDLFQPVFDIPQGRVFTVCYAGGFHIWQGVNNLVRAFQLLEAAPIRLRMIGFRPEDEALKAKIAATLGDKVELIDRVTQSELVKLLAEAHFLIIPRLPHSVVEIAFPTKFSEYLAMGKPVIVSDVDETATLVREHQCGLVSAPTPQALADTILQASQLTRADLIRMGQNGRHLAETVFDWKVVCHNYADLLRRWCS